VRIAAAIALLLLCVGCSTSSRWNPLNLWFGRAAASVEKQQAKEQKGEQQAAQLAAVEVFKTEIALRSAPESRPVEVARRTNTNALSLLQQRGPLSILQTQEAAEIVAGMLAESADLRTKAEKRQAAAERDAAQLSAELATIRSQLATARAKAAEEAANNLALANELRWSKIAAWAGSACSVLLGLAAIAYRMNIGRFQEGAAQVLAGLQQRHGDGAADTARALFDAALHTGEQKGVARAFFSLTKR
jgi:hypothetical protein